MSQKGTNYPAEQNIPTPMWIYCTHFNYIKLIWKGYTFSLGALKVPKFEKLHIEKPNVV